MVYPEQAMSTPAVSATSTPATILTTFMLLKTRAKQRELAVSQEPVSSRASAAIPVEDPRALRERCATCAGAHPSVLPQGLLQIAEDPKARDRDRIAALSELLDRGWGKAPTFANIEGEDPLGMEDVAAEIQAIANELGAQRTK
jgi:hypothetical protein